MGVYTCQGQVVIRLEQAGDNKTWVDVWCNNSETVDRVRSLSLDTGDMISVDRLRCAIVMADSDADKGTMFRFIVDRRGAIERLGRDSAEAEEVRRRLVPTPGEVSYVDRILSAVNSDGSFQPPLSESVTGPAGPQTNEQEKSASGELQPVRTAEDAINNDCDSELRSQPRPSEAGAGGGPATSTQDIIAPPSASNVSPVRPPPASSISPVRPPPASIRPHRVKRERKSKSEAIEFYKSLPYIQINKLFRYFF